MTYFRESEPGGSYFDTNGKSIPHGEEYNYYKQGKMNPSSRKDYEINKEGAVKATKRMIGLIKSIRKSDDSANF